ncbi:leucine-rich repeat-containing protein 34 isoform X6 [Balaenoptera acutorostrata]|uniref:Leucine-rich repeat-containing protein 34 isoform X6 n=1 Tax=Balaenoptera acutorostrata TaxID=9767 RepID=A0A384BD49_BALAC|nr:leucine-rich repeat-containing protein 34 isoform X6 [Balaenoptera acutorostrata]
MQRSPQQAGPESRTPPSAPSTTPTPAWAAADCSAAEPIGGLQEYYYELCMEKSQEIKPFILHILQEVDEEIEKGLVGITLNVAGNCHLMPVERVTGEDFWILCRILKNNPYINGLDVRYNLISDVGVSYAAKLLQKQHNLIYLNLMFNDIGPEGGELIAKALHKNTTLKHLRMTGNKIENKGGMFFAAMLQINSSLEKLDVGDCDLEESTVHLGHMLKENQCLVELHMCKHDIKNCGMKQLCDALYLNRSLRYLDVSCNKITQDGMVCLANVLKSNTTLEVIDLSFNRIENAGANYLSDALASHNRTLKALSVVSNNIEGEGLVALSQSMKTNPTLSNIYIWGNKFDEATRVAYSDLIHMGRLKSDNTDVEPFVVDGHVYLAEVSNGLKRHYYWTPGYGEACSPSSNAGFTLVPVGQYL